MRCAQEFPTLLLSHPLFLAIALVHTASRLELIQPGDDITPDFLHSVASLQRAIEADDGSYPETLAALKHIAELRLNAFERALARQHD
jgi:hypothetical protein